jgi:hypothetical protein
MIAFEVFHNKKRICIAGAQDLSVLSTHITAVGELGSKTIPRHPARHTKDIFLAVTGLVPRKDPTKNVHQRWINFLKLKVGDLVEVKIRDAVRADKPKIRKKITQKLPSP